MIFAAMQLGILASLFAVARGWSLSTSQSDGYWIGIYLNRNSLAPVAAIGILSGVFLLPKWKTRDPSIRAIGRAIIAALVVLNAFVLWRSESTTSPAALALAVIGVLYWQVIRLVATRTEAKSRIVRYSHLVYVAAIGLGMWMLFAVQGRLLALVGETTNFNGRLVHWRFSWNGFLENPLIGYGWQAAWRDPQFLKGEGWWVLPNIMRVVADSGSVSFVVDPNKSWSHSGYFDVLLGGGAIAGAMMVALLVAVIVSQREAIISRESTVWNMAVVWFVVAAASQESFIIGNHFLWLLLSSVLWTAGSTQQQHGRTGTL
jgi:O-antigen ligase